MNNLTITNRNGQLVADSRDVADMIGKRHTDLLRSIESYTKILTNAKMRSLDFFIPDVYKDAKGEERPQYRITRKGCDMVANKLTGAKGVIFTAQYVTKFDEMEKKFNKPASIEDLIIMQAQSVKELKASVHQIQGNQEVLNHRINSLDCTNIEGTPQQRLNAMVKKYAYTNGIVYGMAWKEFKKAFDNAYHTNLEQRRLNCMKKAGIKSLTLPSFLTKAGLIEDSLRVADKMLNEKVN